MDAVKWDCATITSATDVATVEAEMSWPERVPSDKVHHIYELQLAQTMLDPDATAITYLPNGNPDEPALKLSRKAVLGLTHKVASALVDLGVGQDDTVSMLLPSVPQAFGCLWGSIAAGVANPINFLLSADTLAALFQAADTKVVVALGPHPLLPIWDKVMEARKSCPSIKAVIQVKAGPQAPALDEALESDGLYDWDRLMAKSDGAKLPDAIDRSKWSQQRRSALFHSGGTTGAPKLVPHTHENHLYAAWVFRALFEGGADNTILNVLPLFHVSGSIVVALTSLLTGMQQVVPTALGLRHPGALAHIWKTIDKFEIDSVGGVPTHLISMCQQAGADACRGKIKFALTGGAALPLEIEQKWLAVTGVRLHQVYGMTETIACGALCGRSTEPQFGYCGPRVPYMEVRVVDGEGKPVDQGNEGEIHMRGPGVVPGYTVEARNAGTFLADGWINTGDLGSVNTDGHIRVSGRSKDLIIRSGHNIDPAIIEDVLLSHPSVALAAAVGRPDEKAGELVVAYVQPAPDATIDVDELMKLATDKISERPAWPKAIHVVDPMPVTAVGKIFKPALRLLEVESKFAEAAQAAAGEGVTASCKAVTDPKRGTVATVTLQPSPETDREKVETGVREALAKFTLAETEIVWA